MEIPLRQGGAGVQTYIQWRGGGVGITNKSHGHSPIYKYVEVYIYSWYFVIFSFGFGKGLTPSPPLSLGYVLPSVQTSPPANPLVAASVWEVIKMLITFLSHKNVDNIFKRLYLYSWGGEGGGVKVFFFFFVRFTCLINKKRIICPGKFLTPSLYKHPLMNYPRVVVKLRIDSYIHLKLVSWKRFLRCTLF